MSTEGTSICLVTMDRPEILIQTLKALEQSVQQPAEIIIVDNGSTDPSTLTYLAQASAKGWTVVRNEKNLGLSRATNQGLALGKFPVLIHLDADALLTEPGWNHRLHSYFQYEKVGLAVPYQGKEYIPQGPYREIRWSLGYCWAMRKTLFEDIGGYDPGLIHQNEVDLALRVRMADYHVAGVTDVHPLHNEPKGERSELSKAREHLGCVQFRSKWAEYHKGRGWNYGTLPLYLSQHVPIEQEWYRRYAIAHGVNLNPVPPGKETSTGPGAPDLGITPENVQRVPRQIEINGLWYSVYCDLRNDYSYWINDDDSYAIDMQRAIDRWEELTGERWTGYKWPINLLRVE